MSKSIDYYLSLISPWAFLGSARLEDIAARHGATVAVKPVDFGTIFARSGGLPLPRRAPARQAYRMVELKRWTAFLGIALNLEPKHFPTDETRAAGCVIAAGKAGGDPLRLAHAFLHAVWVEDLDIAERTAVERILTRTGHDAAAILADGERPETEAERAALSQEALDRGVFGAPSYLLDGELFWGQDRVEFLDRALAAS